MTEINRKKFRTTKISSLKEQKKKAQLSNEGGGGKYTNFHTIEEGKNIFRIAPVQPDEPEGAVFFRKVLTTQLECEVKEYVDGQETGKTELKRKKIFCARLHSSDEEIQQKDILLAYIHFAWEKAKQLYPTDKDEQKKYMGYINGYRKDNKWIWGIKPNETYIGYAWKDDVLGRVEVYPQIMSKIEALDMDDEGGDDIAEVDILSDVDNGLPIKIVKDKKNGSWEYTVATVVPRRGQEDEFYAKWQLSDAQLEELVSKDTLTDLYVGSFKKKDFDMLLDGLQRFDEKYEYDIFENEAYVDLVEEAASLFENEKPEVKKEKKVSKKVIEEKEEVEEEETIDFEDMTPPKLKKYLREAISKMKDGEDILDAEDETWSFSRKKGDLIELCERAEVGTFIKAHLNIKEVEEEEEDDVEVEEELEEVVEKKTSPARKSFRDRVKKD